MFINTKFRVIFHVPYYVLLSQIMSNNYIKIYNSKCNLLTVCNFKVIFKMRLLFYSVTHLQLKGSCTHLKQHELQLSRNTLNRALLFTTKRFD